MTAQKIPAIADSVAKLAKQLVANDWLLATAESCTGGGVANACTDLAGSSAWFQGSVVSYSNQIKTDVLGVSDVVLEQHGAVSVECALAMARGAQLLLQTAVAVSTTGIAGPDGGSRNKPVGMVCFGFAIGKKLYSDIQYFQGDRQQVRQQACAFALARLSHYLSDK
ncbi:MAG: CinA family protein [Gammaproteobacteria bacterium]|nr:CinA family protein [Gammaproteobacteria bacterium]